MTVVDGPYAIADRHFADADGLLAALVDDIAGQLRRAVSERGTALMAVSGGSSPKRLFEHLAQVELPWSQVTVTQVDERWLPVDHPDSNARLIRKHLLRDAAAAAHFLPLKNAADTPESGQAACEAQLRALALPFDLVLLGMGEDGHTASLFPHAPELDLALRNDGPLCAAVQAPRPPQAPHPRMSLTLAGLTASRRILLPLQGDAKLAVLREAQQAGALEDMPIRALLRQARVPLEIWTSP